MDEAKRLAPIHLHVSEEDVQVERAREETGLTPFGILHRAGALTARCSWDTACGLNRKTCSSCGRTPGLHFVPKPMKLASGRGGFFDYYKKLNYGFGTDGAASSNTLNPMEQARLFGLLGKYQDRDSSHFTAGEIWQHLMAGHQAFPFGTGRLEEGSSGGSGGLGSGRNGHLSLLQSHFRHFVQQQQPECEVYHGGRRIPEI